MLNVDNSLCAFRLTAKKSDRHVGRQIGVSERAFKRRVQLSKHYEILHILHIVYVSFARWRSSSKSLTRPSCVIFTSSVPITVTVHRNTIVLLQLQFMTEKQSFDIRCLIFPRSYQIFIVVCCLYIRYRPSLYSTLPSQRGN